MSSSINSISMAMSSSLSYTAMNTQKLSEATKKELEALGICTTNIRTEAQGQTTLKSVQSGIKLQSEQSQQNKAEDAHQSSLRDQIMSLFADLGVIASKLKKIEDLLEELKERIEKLKRKAEAEKKEDAKIAQYQERLKSIEKQYASENKSEPAFRMSANHSAMLNKLFMNMK